MRGRLRSVLLLVCVSLLLACAAAQVLKGSAPPPAGSTILLPEEGFTGGVLTGVVLGPDDQPVPNAPVNIDGGVPITLSGEVIGDEPPKRPQPDHPATAGKPPVELPPVGVPQDCAAVLQRAQALIAGSQGAEQVPLGGAQPGSGQENSPTAGYDTFLTPQGGGLVTDAAGHFAVCVRPGSTGVNVSLADGSVHTSVPTSSQAPTDACDQASRFLQPGVRLSICQRIRKPSLAQGGKTWELPAAVAISSGGDRVLTTVRAPRELRPGSATLSFVDASGQTRSFTGGVFKILSAPGPLAAAQPPGR